MKGKAQGDSGQKDEGVHGRLREMPQLVHVNTGGERTKMGSHDECIGVVGQSVSNTPATVEAWRPNMRTNLTYTHSLWTQKVSPSAYRKTDRLT